MRMERISKMKEGLAKRCFAAIASAVVAFAMCVPMAAPAFAANTAVSGGATTFTKYLVVEAQANVPNVTFDFTIDAGDAVAGTAGNPAIYAGVMTPTAPTVATVSFTNADTGGAAVGKPDDSSATGYKYVKKTVMVDLNGVTFTAPGIYRYVITETESEQSGIQYDGLRTLDVYVEYKENSLELEVSHYVLHEGEGNPNTATKSDGFTNEYTSSDLKLVKQVTGNQGDRDKYFKFRVNITGAISNSVLAVDTTKDAGTNESDETTNPTSLTVGEDGIVSHDFYLKHGESIVIKGLNPGALYTITEDDYVSEGYTTTYKVDGAEEAKAGNVTSGNMASDHSVVFTNAKMGAVPTGVLLETAPYIILGTVVLAGLVVLFATGRRRAGE